MATPNAPDQASRIQGSLVGLAAVDALGGPVEFKKRGTFPLVTSMIPNLHAGVPPGTWTDDTSMALCLAQSLIDYRGVFRADDQVFKYMAWYEEGYLSAVDDCFDIGISTRTALETWRRIVQSFPSIAPASPDLPLPGQNIIDGGLKHERASGNGSLMRVAPIGLVYHHDVDAATQYATLSSNVTHPYPTNAEACVIYTRLLILAVRGKDRSELMAGLAGFPFQDHSLAERFRRYQRVTDFERPHEEISSSGYVVDTLEAALWAFFSTSSFREGAIKVVNLGDDADTVGAVYGGLAGAFYGLDAIPREWHEALQKKETVDRIAAQLLEVAGGTAKS
ncbi:MAG: hypothetical protein M1838_002880 [Thelocarpon superellum]|nr:MAG: hypothetical protein M1838_002880 [Thelocarpon superellum]